MPPLHKRDAPQPGKILSFLRVFLGTVIFLMTFAPFVVHYSFHYYDHDGELPRLDGDRIVWPSERLLISKTNKYHANETEGFGNGLPNVSLPTDIGTSGRALLLHALRPRPIWDDDINPIIEAKRCATYFHYDEKKIFNIRYNPNRKKRRRIFLGSLIADDSWHALGAIAMETYGIYTAVVFVESNRTQTGSARQLRFVNGTLEHKILVESNLFGPNTKVHVGNFAYEGFVVGGELIREHRQRHKIFNLWEKAGMTPEDIGILSDADETPSRDFLRALQTCDIPQLDYERQNCHSPKLVAASLVFEGSPECMTTRKWMHPELMLGKCIEGIGNKKYKLSKKRGEKVREFGWREVKFSAMGNYSGWPKEKTSE